jgi:hypothetical protein
MGRAHWLPEGACLSFRSEQVAMAPPRGRCPSRGRAEPRRDRSTHDDHPFGHRRDRQAGRFTTRAGLPSSRHPQRGPGGGPLMSAIPAYTVAGDASGRPVERDCVHLDHVHPVEPATPGACEDCLREGTQWCTYGSASSAATSGAVTARPADTPPRTGTRRRTHWCAPSRRARIGPGASLTGSSSSRTLRRGSACR